MDEERARLVDAPSCVCWSCLIPSPGANRMLTFTGPYIPSIKYLSSSLSLTLPFLFSFLFSLSFSIFYFFLFLFFHAFWPNGWQAGGRHILRIVSWGRNARSVIAFQVPCITASSLLMPLCSLSLSGQNEAQTEGGRGRERKKENVNRNGR